MITVTEPVVPRPGSDKAGAVDFRVFPEHVNLEDTIATQDPAAPPDPTMGRDADLNWLLRTAG
jgi:hypothetical protein